MIIYPLRAAHGDALIVEEMLNEQTYRIVVDGGPEDTADIIAERYNKIGHIALLVLTHYDEDHIKGILKYIESLKEGERVIDTVWANCANAVYYDVEENTAAYDDAFTLSKHLDKLKRQGVIGEWKDGITIETQQTTIGPFLIDVLSPTKAVNEELRTQYQHYIDEEGLKDDPDTDEEVSYGRVLSDASKNFDDLVKSFKPNGTSFMNRSSIALRVSAYDKTILLLADAAVKTITDSLIRLEATADNPMKIDLVKMSHHGSKANISKLLFDLICCDQYLFTSNGGSGGAYHPDRQTIACLQAWAKGNQEKKTLYFNYPISTIMQRNTGFLNDEEKNHFIIIDNYPTDNPAITL